MPARRSLPDYPSLRYPKVEAKERTRSGELAALHEAQLAIAREHGLPGWPALCRLAGQQMPAQSWVLPHVRWLISRTRDAGEPGWAPPNDGEARQHFSGRFLDVVQVQELFEIIAGDAARLGEELLVLTLTPLTGRFRHVGREIWVGVEAEPPHLISGLTGFALGSAARARSARPASVTVSRTVCTRLPGRPRPGKSRGATSGHTGMDARLGANVKPGHPPERAPESCQAATHTAP
jgi:hypothetical protein